MCTFDIPLSVYKYFLLCSWTSSFNLYQYSHVWKHTYTYKILGVPLRNKLKQVSVQKYKQSTHTHTHAHKHAHLHTQRHAHATSCTCKCLCFYSLFSVQLLSDANASSNLKQQPSRQKTKKFVSSRAERNQLIPLTFFSTFSALTKPISSTTINNFQCLSFFSKFHVTIGN